MDVRKNVNFERFSQDHTMMINQITEFSRYDKSRLIQAFEEALIDHELYLTATSLYDMGFQRDEEIYLAVERAMKICDMNGLPIREHFRTIYVADDERHTVIRDWKLSKLAHNQRWFLFDFYILKHGAQAAPASLFF